MTSTAVVRSLDPFEVMDRWDEQQMLDEMKGAIAKTLVYSFKMDGKTVTGLSKVGVDECCIVLAQEGQVIREEDVSYQLRGEGEKEEALFKAFAARYAVSSTGEALLDRVVGVKRQPLYEMRGQTLKPNPHWFEHGAMKALRNARFRLIPSKTREAVIAMAKEGGAVREMRPTDQTPDYEELESKALKELEQLIPTLPSSQQEYVKGKLRDGSNAVDLLEATKERARPKGTGPAPQSGLGPTNTGSDSSTEREPGED